MATSSNQGRPQGKHAAAAGQKPAAKRFKKAGDEAAAPRARASRFKTQQPQPALPDEAPMPRISSDAPRPVDPAQATAFSTISSSEGAVLHDRETASEAADAARSNLRRGPGQRIQKSRRPQVQGRTRSAKMSRPVAIGVAVMALVVVGAIVAFVATSLAGPSTSLEGDPEDTQRVEQVQADKSDGILYDNYTYACNEDKDQGGYAFVRYAQGSNEPLVLFQLQGTPVTEVLYNGAFVIPQNLGESWNVVAWTMGDGSEPTALTNEDGSPVEGDGSIASATLDGSNLVLSFDNDATMTVPLG